MPLTLAIILMLLYLSFRNFTQALMVMAAVPLSLVGGFWLVYLLGYELSVAVAVGFIALAGVAAEFGVVMMVYLDEAVKCHRPATLKELRAAVIEGAVQRVRPKAMTAAVIFAGMLPIMFGMGTGAVSVVERAGDGLKQECNPSRRGRRSHNSLIPGGFVGAPSRREESPEGSCYWWCCGSAVPGANNRAQEFNATTILHPSEDSHSSSPPALPVEDLQLRTGQYP